MKQLSIGSIRYFVPLLLLVIFPARAMACGICALSMVYHYIPFMNEWLLILGLWWLAHLYLRRKRGCPPAFSIAFSIVFIVIAIVLFPGMHFIPLLLVLAVFGFLRVLELVFGSWMGERGRLARRYAILYSVFLALLLGTMAYRIHWLHGSGDRLDYFLKVSQGVGDVLTVIGLRGENLGLKEIEPGEIVSRFKAGDRKTQNHLLFLVFSRKEEKDLPYMFPFLREIDLSDWWLASNMTSYLETISGTKFNNAPAALIWAETHVASHQSNDPAP